MRQVKHPKCLYIQLNDENPEMMGMAFSDGVPGSDNTIDFNAFDNETRQRALLLLKTAYNFIQDRPASNGSN